MLTTMRPQPGEDGGHQSARLLLTGHGIRVPPMFADSDMAALRSAATSDPRLAEAAALAKNGEFIQYLAGVPVLLERYQMAPDGARALILAALDARRLGHSREFSLSLLEAGAQGYLTDSPWHRLARQHDWLAQALSYTEAESRGIPGPLAWAAPRPGKATSVQPYYLLSDYLEQHIGASRETTAIPAALWEALFFHRANGYELMAMAMAAHRRGLLRLACQFYSAAARAGHAEAHGRVASILESAGRIDEALEWWIYDAENQSIHPDYINAEHIASLLERAGRTEEAITWWQRAAAGGSRYAAEDVIGLLERAGRFDEAATWLIQRGSWHLESTPDAQPRDCEEDTAYFSALVARLLVKAGRVQEAMPWWQRSLAADDFFGPAMLVGVDSALVEEDKVDEAVTWLRVAAGEDPAPELAEMEQTLIKAAQETRFGASKPAPTRRPADGDTAKETGSRSRRINARHVAIAQQQFQELARQGQLEEALQRMRSRIYDGAYIGAELEMVIAALSVAGREEEAAQWCQTAAINPKADYESRISATGKAAQLLAEAGRTEEAITWLKSIAEDHDLMADMQGGGIHIMREAATQMTRLLAEKGRVQEAVTWLQSRANSGSFDALQLSAQLLSDAGQREEAEILWRYGWDPDGSPASPWTASPPSG